MFDMDPAASCFEPGLPCFEAAQYSDALKDNAPTWTTQGFAFVEETRTCKPVVSGARASTIDGFGASTRRTRRGDNARAPAALPGKIEARSTCITTLVPIRPRRRGERRSLRTLSPGVSLRPGSLAFNPRPRRLSTPLLTPFNSTPTTTLSDASTRTTARGSSIASCDFSSTSSRARAATATWVSSTTRRRARACRYASPGTCTIPR